MNEIEEIKNRLNIVDVVADYLQLKKAGVNFKARCPFHQEKTPSFYVSPPRQIWHCFGCGLGGDVFEFVKQIEGVDFPQALERLAQKAGVELRRGEFSGKGEVLDRKKVLFELNELAASFYHKVLTDSRSAQEARDYLRSRGFASATISKWRIGYAPEQWDALYQFLKKKGYKDADITSAGLTVRKTGEGQSFGNSFFDRFRDRIMFPIVDSGGRTVGFSGRILHPKENVGKYINTPDTPIYNKSQVLFGFYQARTEIRRRNEAVVVEGNVDVIKSHQAGVLNVVASSGTALTAAQLRSLSRLCENLIFAFDADTAGAEATKRAVLLALEADFNVKIASLPAGVKDPDELIEKGGDLWQQAVAKAENYLDFYFREIFDKINLSDAIAKKRAVVDFLGVLTKVSDPVVSSHYVRKVAEKIGVKEQAVIELLERFKQQPRPAAVSRSGASRSPKLSGQELLERRFWGLVMRMPLDSIRYYLSRHAAEHFLEDEHKKIYRCASVYFADKSASPDGFFRSYPEFKTKIQLAVFSTEAEFTEAAAVSNELRDVSNRLLINYFNREKQRLTQAIAQAERAGQEQEKQRLVLEFNKLTQQLQELE